MRTHGRTYMCLRAHPRRIIENTAAMRTYLPNYTLVVRISCWYLRSVKPTVVSRVAM